MAQPERKNRGSVLRADDWNNVVTAVQGLLRSGGQNALLDSTGLHVRTPPSQSIANMFIAEVDSDATGGGYYNCHLQTLDATDWDTTTADQLDDVGDSVVVLNLAEIGSSIHNLAAGDLIICWKFNDDEATERYVGMEVIGRHTSGEW